MNRRTPFLILLSAAIVLVVAGCIQPAKVNPRALRHNDTGARLLARGALTEAEPHFDIAIEYHPLFEKPHHNKGLLALRRGDLDAALGHFLRAAELNPDFADAQNGAGQVFLERGKLSDARAFFKRALEVNPGLAQARFNLARTLVAEGRLADARAEYRKLVASTPGGALGYAGLGTVAHAMGRRAEAEEHYAQALQREAGCEEALLGLGALRLARTDLTGAIDAYRRARVAHPASARAQHALAFALLRADRVDEGRAVLRALVRQAPHFAPAHFLEGVVAELEGHLAASEAALRRALRVRGQHYPEADYRLCKLLATVGRREDGRRHCLRFAKSAPKGYESESKEARGLALPDPKAR